MDSSGVSASRTHPQPLRFRCPGCQAILQAAPEHAGKHVKCSECSQLLPVPGAAPQRSEALKPKKFIICICGTCKHIFKTPPDSAEQTAACPGCGNSVEIPTQTSQVTDSGTFRFQCKTCRQDYCVLSKYGGKKFICLGYNLYGNYLHRSDLSNPGYKP